MKERICEFCGVEIKTFEPSVEFSNTDVVMHAKCNIVYSFLLKEKGLYKKVKEIKQKTNIKKEKEETITEICNISARTSFN